MDNTGLMRGFQRFGNLLRDWQRLIHRDRPLRDPVGERRSLDQLQHERPRPVALLDAVDLRDVGVVEGRENVCFALETREAIRIVGERVGENLQRDIAVELRVGRLPHLSHATLAEERGHVVMPETVTDGESHGFFECR